MATVYMATVNKKRHNRPKRYWFDCVYASDAENEMARLGYDCSQYSLCTVDTNDCLKEEDIKP